MRGYPDSLFRGSTVSSAQVPDVKFQAHGYLFLARNSLLTPRYLKYNVSKLNYTLYPCD